MRTRNTAAHPHTHTTSAITVLNSLQTEHGKQHRDTDVTIRHQMRKTGTKTDSWHRGKPEHVRDACGQIRVFTENLSRRRRSGPEISSQTEKLFSESVKAN